MRVYAMQVVAICACAAGLVTSSQNVRADNVNITIENTQSTGGFFLTPFWVAVHDGQFDTYDSGAFASSSITAIAEGGDTAPISSDFSASSSSGGSQDTLAAVASVGDAPVFSPGESASLTLNVANTMQNRYFSYASMIVPSNDLFVANGNPMAHEVFDAAGNFTGPLTIEIFGGEVNDNGTEVNDAFGDAAFSVNGGTRTAENNVIRAFFTEMGDADYVTDFVGTDTANGATISQTFGASDLIARITITPEPASALMLAAGSVVLIRKRRRGVRELS